MYLRDFKNLYVSSICRNGMFWLNGCFFHVLRSNIFVCNNDFKNACRSLCGLKSFPWRICESKYSVPVPGNLYKLLFLLSKWKTVTSNFLIFLVQGFVTCGERCAVSQNFDFKSYYNDLMVTKKIVSKWEKTLTALLKTAYAI